MRFLLPLAAALLATGCAEPIDRSDADEAPPSLEAAGAAADPVDAMPPPVLEIPDELRGRWGFVPADCTSTMGDAKGLIEVSEDAVRFYESRGMLDSIPEGEAQDGTFRATYAFSGEGQQWSRDMQLAISEDGTRLTRTEFGEDALAEPLTYTRCDLAGDEDA